MLTAKMVRVRYAKQNIIPLYLDPADEEWQETAGRMLHIYRGAVGKTRGELEDEIDDTFGDSPNQLVHQGFAKLLEDRCDFAVVSGHPPEELRAAVFAAAASQRRQRKAGLALTEEAQPADESQPAPADDKGALPLSAPALDRGAVLGQVGGVLGMTAEQVERGLFADLRTEQQITAFKDITVERLLQRYNVALAQGVLLRATSIEARVRGEAPQRYRQLLRLIKFHRLMCDIEQVKEDTYALRLDGPLSLFSATNKYGVQLAQFLPALLKCKEFEVRADLLWGPQRAAKKFALSHKDGLVSHHVDSGMYVPPELALFVELFRKRVDDWEISEETEIVTLGKSFWVPDYQLIHKDSGQIVYLEVLGFWRRASVERHLERLRLHATTPFVLAVSEQLHVEEAELEGLPASVMRFKQMPLPKDVVQAASALLGR